MRFLLQVSILPLMLEIVLFCPKILSAAPDRKGETLFNEKCLACHTIGGGKRIGPDLRGIIKIRDREWLLEFIAQPDKMMAKNDPLAIQLLKEFNNIQMPSFGLSREEVASILTYIESQEAMLAEGKTTEPLSPVPKTSAKADRLLPSSAPVSVGLPETPSEENVAAGRRLFTGDAPFQKGGPPCLSCHGIAGLMAMGGGTLGPDLTPVVTKFGEEGTLAILANPPYPTMKPIYDNHPLTAEEQLFLRDFLKESSDKIVESFTARLNLWALGGLVLFLGGIQILWYRRLKSVRTPLVAGRKGGSRS